MHPEKGVRNAKHAAPLGIEIDGVRGLAGAERLRRHQLAHLSLALGRQGRWSAAARRQLTSSWAFCLEARRPMLCLLDGLYRELGPVDPHAEPIVIELSSVAVSELSLLAALAPLMCTDLRLPHSDVIVATDASEEGLAGCVAPMSLALHAECWRVRDRRGRPTRLEPEASASAARQRSLRRSAPAVLDEDLDFPEVGQVGPDRVLIETFDSRGLRHIRRPPFQATAPESIVELNATMKPCIVQSPAPRRTCAEKEDSRTQPERNRTAGVGCSKCGDEVSEDAEHVKETQRRNARARGSNILCSKCVSKGFTVDNLKEWEGPESM